MAAVAQVRRVVVDPATREGGERYRVESAGLPVLKLRLESARQVRQAVVAVELLAAQETGHEYPGVVVDAQGTAGAYVESEQLVRQDLVAAAAPGDVIVVRVAKVGLHAIHDRPPGAGPGRRPHAGSFGSRHDHGSGCGVLRRRCRWCSQIE